MAAVLQSSLPVTPEQQGGRNGGQTGPLLLLQISLTHPRPSNLTSQTLNTRFSRYLCSLTIPDWIPHHLILQIWHTGI
jgi:hypothetical protein